MLCFGFASGLPLLLTNFTLQQWLSESGVSLRAIGATALIGLPYVLKFAWAPIFDRVRPGPLARLGRRRGWLVPVQAALALALLALGRSHPPHALALLAALAVAVAVLSASQDVLIDAWRIETYPASRQGNALAAYVWGYRLAMLVAQSGTLLLAGRIGWHGAYAVMAALALAGIVPTLAAPRTPASVARETAPPPAGSAGLHAAVIAPLADLLRRERAGSVLALVLLFQLGTALADTVAVPFYRALGFDRAAIAVAASVPALLGAVVGAGIGGVLVARVGARRALLATACVQMASLSLYLVLADTGGVRDVLVAKVALEAAAEGMASAAFLAWLSGLCSAAYTATQYALLSSLAPLAWRTLAGTSGVLASRLGWSGFFVLAIVASLPAIVLIARLADAPAPAPDRVAAR